MNVPYDVYEMNTKTNKKEMPWTSILMKGEVFFWNGPSTIQSIVFPPIHTQPYANWSGHSFQYSRQRIDRHL